MMSKLLKITLGLIFFMVFIPQPLIASDKETLTPIGDKLWEINSVDTMKYSRDASRDPIIKKLIPIDVKAVADTGANYIAIDTPYDDEFIPVLKMWVGEARKYKLKVWFRGNFSGWEGWFNYPKLSSTTEHIQKTYRFITQNPDIFEDGDIFTPAPEAEAGLMGDPRQTRKFDEFNKFLTDSYDNCSSAFNKISKTVDCGVWSLNPDVVREVLTKATVQHLGGVVSIDHYAKTPEAVISVVKELAQKFDAKVVLGEFGAPIPDINGTMTDAQQAAYIKQVMQLSYENKDIMRGMNYWVIAGGSTSLLHDDNSEKPAIDSLREYFNPSIVTGKVKDYFGDPLKDIDVSVINTPVKVKTSDNGSYKLLVPASNQDFEIEASSEAYAASRQTFNASAGANLRPDIILEPVNPNLLYTLRKMLQQLLHK